MKNLDRYLGHCYIEVQKDCIFIYKIIKQDEIYGLRCHEVQLGPTRIWVYEDFPEHDIVDDNGLIFIETYIPDINPECIAQEISEDFYYSMIKKVEVLYALQEQINDKIKDFVRKAWTGQESIKK